jgi:hypothetical protein
MLSCVPAGPDPASSRHLPDWGFSSVPSGCARHTCAPVPLQPYSCTGVPSALAPSLTSRHVPSACTVPLVCTVHDCAPLPLQPKTCTAVRSTRLAERTSTHRPPTPTIGPVTGPAGRVAEAVAPPGLLEAAEPPDGVGVPPGLAGTPPPALGPPAAGTPAPMPPCHTSITAAKAMATARKASAPGMSHRVDDARSVITPT